MTNLFDYVVRFLRVPASQDDNPHLGEKRALAFRDKTARSISLWLAAGCVLSRHLGKSVVTSNFGRMGECVEVLMFPFLGLHLCEDFFSLPNSNASKSG
jgi:hypothetical protein